MGGEDDVDSSTGRGSGDSGCPLRSQAFAMGGFDSRDYSFADSRSYHSSHSQGREANSPERLIVDEKSPFHSPIWL
jgi:hypothetical protein